MEITVKRITKEEKYTAGKMYINGKYFCDTIEDKDRCISQKDSISTIKKVKVMHETAIPTGKYNVTLDIVSPRFSTKEFYKTVCNGKLPRILNVPGFDGILIHVGDGPKGAELSSGCILIGKSVIKGQLTEGKKYFTELYKELLKDKNHITIEIS